ncbi:KPN_02809 family neutral zinc metallopeptidase [Rhabdaerophilum calidifontis]|uniref:KPN_02809 family neutral zinc metallopeptidase n=1 Tax=Rhabdaerophilum calidifontis TaxID=2604328 RepID=UPI00123897C3|nr:neutral zinc metallopeptidase [Rhabdaerophilum calidifontis]
MRLDDIEESSNVEDRRGQGGGFGGGFPGGRGGLGIGTIAVLTLVGWALGINPAILIGGAEMIQGRGGQVVSQSAPPRASSPQEEQLRQFVARVLKTNEDVWERILPEQRRVQYRNPRLVLFRGATRSQCGGAQSAMGPFYCPLDERVYLDMSFFEEMRTKMRAGGDFAYAYVIAHEVGHHVENVLGILPKVQAMQQRLSRREANALSVRVELMADCLAGVWAHHAQQRWRILEQGDIEEALTAAAAIGDDKLQKQAQGYVVPDSFTHGTSEQRARWLTQGLRTGSIQACDTFNSRAL